MKKTTIRFPRHGGDARMVHRTNTSLFDAPRRRR